MPRASLIAPALMSLFVAINPGTALAKCSAFALLAEMLDYIDELPEQTSHKATARIGYKIEALRRRGTRESIANSLEQLGMERYLDDFLRLDVKNGALAYIAIVGGPEMLGPYMMGSGYQRALHRVTRVVDLVCDAEDGKDPSSSTLRPLGTTNNIKAAGNISANNGISANGKISTTSSISTDEDIILPQVPREFAWAALLCFVFLIVGALVVAQLRRQRSEQIARRNKRFACSLPVTVIGRTGTFSLLALDISRAGMNLAGHPDTAVGDTLTIDFGPFPIAGIVRWRSENFTGLQFPQPLSATQLLNLLNDYCRLSALDKKKRGSPKEAARNSFLSLISGRRLKPQRR